MLGEEGYVIGYVIIVLRYMSKIIILLVVLIVAGGIFFSFGRDDQKASAPTVSEMNATPAMEQSATPPLGGTGTVALTSPQHTEEIIIKASNWYFEPEEIRVSAGTRVKIILEGVSGTHAFALPELGVKSEAVKPGETTTVEFNADKKGEFSFKCSVFCGEGHSGMLGKFIVE